jgi:galactokinase
MKKEERKALLADKFQDLFGGQPSIWTRAPGRVDLMGSHTDYNLGYVLTMTIDRDTWIAARPRYDRKVAVYSLNLERGGEFHLDRIAPNPHERWLDYIQGVAMFIQDAGYPLSGLEGVVHTTVPLGSGLSSSAAIEMSSAVAFQMTGGFMLDPVEMALVGQKAENQFVGVNSGILDQYSSALGQEGCGLLLDCRNLTSRAAPIAEGLSVVICDTRAERNLTGTEYGERRDQCEEGVARLRQVYPEITALRDVSLNQFVAYEDRLPETIARRCRFIIEENQRVLDLAEALPTGDPAHLNRLMADSYTGARDLYEIGAPAMEAMIGAMCSSTGIVGARQAGAGFGGCMVALVRSQEVAAFTEDVTREYFRRTDIRPDVYPVRATAGAGSL